MQGVVGAVGGLVGSEWVWECLRYRGVSKWNPSETVSNLFP